MALWFITGTGYGEMVEQRMIDLRGLCSPQPVLVLADEAERVGPGETIGVLSDDPSSSADFSGWCASAQMEMLGLQRLDGGVDRFVFRRPPVAERYGPEAMVYWALAV